MRLSVSNTIDQQKLSQLGAESSRRVRAAIKDGMTQSKPLLKAAGDAHIAAKLQVKKKSALNAWKVKTLPENGSKPMALNGHIKGDYMKLHATGGVIAPGGFMFIPLPGGKKIRAKRVSQMIANGELVVRLMAGKFMVFRGGLTRSGRARKEKPVGILVRKVRVKKRLSIEPVVRGVQPQVARQLDAAVARALASLSVTRP